MGILSILGYWRELLIATLLGTTMTFYLLWSHATGEIREVKVIERIADEQAEKNYDTLKAAIPRMVEQVEKNTWANAKARFGTCNVAGGIRADSVLPTFSGGQDVVAERNEPEQRELVAVGRPFIQQCAEDAGYRELFVKACLGNPMICEFK